MRIGFEVSGGIGGLFALDPLGIELDAAELEPELRRVLERWLEEKAPENAPAGAPSRVRDARRYVLGVHADAGHQRFVFEDPAVPVELRPLFGELERRARESRVRSKPR